MEFAKLSAAKTTTRSLCPACRKIHDAYPEGIVTLRWPDLDEHEAEIRGLIVNEEVRTLVVNSLTRVKKIVTFSKHEMEVQTMSDQLAKRIGRELVRAFGEVSRGGKDHDREPINLAVRAALNDLFGTLEHDKRLECL